MNISLLVNHDLASTLALNYLLPQLSGHLASAFYSRKPTRKTAAPALLDLHAFEAQAMAQLDDANKPDTLRSMANLSPYTVPTIEQMNAVNDRDFSRLNATEPDLIVCIRHMTILQQPVIQLPKYGVINLHSGLLPGYQGVMASFQAMLRGEETIGTTLHFIENNSIDTGAIIGHARVSCLRQKSYLWNVLNLYKSGCKLIVDVIDRIDNNQAVLARKQSGAASYFTFPSALELTAFADAGLRLFEPQDLDDFFACRIN